MSCLLREAVILEVKRRDSKWARQLTSVDHIFRLVPYDHSISIYLIYIMFMEWYLQVR
jgi:hypothetical protein